MQYEEMNIYARPSLFTNVLILCYLCGDFKKLFLLYFDYLVLLHSLWLSDVSVSLSVQFYFYISLSFTFSFTVSVNVTVSVTVTA